MSRAQLTSTVEQNTGGAVSPYVAGKNKVINGDFGIWQRGTSISLAASSDGYTADRWRQFTQANQATTITRQVTNDTTNLPFIQYCARIQRNSGQTGTTQMSFIQGLETINSVPYAGKTVTLSFYARAGANFSPTSNAFNAMIYTGTGTDQFPTSYTGGASVGLTTFNITTTWVRYSITGTIPTTATEFGTYFYWNPTGTASTNDYVEITGVQLEAGSVATPFSTATGTLSGELAACQRYYWRSSTSQDVLGSGVAASTTTAYTFVQLPVQMRSNPTFSANSGGSYFTLYCGNVNPGVNTISTVYNATTRGALVSWTTSGMNTSSGVVVIATNASAYLEASAEL